MMTAIRGEGGVVLVLEGDDPPSERLRLAIEDPGDSCVREVVLTSRGAVSLYAALERWLKEDQG